MRVEAACIATSCSELLPRAGADATVLEAALAQASKVCLEADDPGAAADAMWPAVSAALAAGVPLHNDQARHCLCTRHALVCRMQLSCMPHTGCTTRKACLGRIHTCFDVL